MTTSKLFKVITTPETASDIDFWKKEGIVAALLFKGVRNFSVVIYDNDNLASLLHRLKLFSNQDMFD